MWKLVQEYEKTHFVEYCINKDYESENILCVNVKNRMVSRLNNTYVDDFLSENIILLVRE